MDASKIAVLDNAEDGYWKDPEPVSLRTESLVLRALLDMKECPLATP